MGDDGVASPGFRKSVRSLLDTLNSLEREMEVILSRTRTGSSEAIAGAYRRIVGSTFRVDGRSRPLVDLTRVLRLVSVGLDTSMFSKGLARTLGLVDDAALEQVRSEVREVMEQVARLREREIALAGGISQLRARSARFDEALAGLARVQGKYVARLDSQARHSHDIERLAGRRDDHITRLIRDTAAQRAELERVARQMAVTAESPAEPRAEDAGATPQLAEGLAALQAEISDFKRMQKQGTQGLIDALDSLRDRVGKIEARVAEMSREARAKRGRLDALARHVAGVENRLTSALGTGGKPVVAVAAERDSSVHATG